MPEQEPTLCCTGCDGELDADGYCPSPSCDVNGAEHYDANDPEQGPMPTAPTELELLEAELQRRLQAALADQPPVHLALCRAAAAVRGVAKDRSADPDQGGYKFRGIDGVLGAVHFPLAEAGVLMVPRDLEIERETWPHWGHGKWTFYRVHLEWEIYGPRGDTIIVTNWGEALDNGDKGLGKARSYAQKDLLIRLLTIPTDDPDMDTEATRYETDTPGVEGGQQQGQRRRQASGGDGEGGGDVAEPADPEMVAELQLIIAGLDDERKAKVREAWMRALGGVKPEALDARAAKRARALITGMVPDHAKVLEQTRMKVQIGDLPDPTTPEPEDDGGAAQGDGSEGDTSSTTTAEASPVDARAEGDTSTAATGDTSTPASDDGSAPGGDDASGSSTAGEDDASPRREQNRSIATVLRSWIDAIGDPKVLEQHTTEVSDMAWQTVDKDLRDTFGVDAPGELHVDLRRLALVVGRAVGPEAIAELIAEGHLQQLEQPEGE